MLPRAVADGHDLEAREAIVNAIFLGGMAFNNTGLGYVHAMAHQLGAVYHYHNCFALDGCRLLNVKMPNTFQRLSVMWLKARTSYRR